jgi:hypothetical protein
MYNTYSGGCFETVNSYFCIFFDDLLSYHPGFFGRRPGTEKTRRGGKPRVDYRRL